MVANPGEGEWVMGHGPSRPSRVSLGNRQAYPQERQGVTGAQLWPPEHVGHQEGCLANQAIQASCLSTRQAERRACRAAACNAPPWSTAVRAWLGSFSLFPFFVFGLLSPGVLVSRLVVRMVPCHAVSLTPTLQSPCILKTDPCGPCQQFIAFGWVVSILFLFLGSWLSGTVTYQYVTRVPLSLC